MYRTGPYYRRKRHFPLFPKELMVISFAVMLGAVGVMNLAPDGSDSPAELAGHFTKGQSGGNWQEKAKKTAVPPASPAQSPQKMITSAGTTAADAARTAAESATKPAPMQDLSNPAKKELAMQLVSSAENSSLDWKGQFSYIEDIGDGRGYTAGIIGFCSGTGDMLELVERYAKTKPSNPLAGFLPALRKVNGTDSHAGLGAPFEKAWKLAAEDPAFQKAQESERDRVYFNPAVSMAKSDGLGTLGQFAYYDAAVMHGPDAWGGGLPDLRDRALKKAKTPKQGGDEAAYLNAFLEVRKTEMSKESAHRNVSRIDDAQLAFLRSGNLGLDTPLNWKMYGDSFSIPSR